MPVAKKSVAKKVPGPLVFEADLKKGTPGALQFTEDVTGAEAVSGGLYLRKAHLDGFEPQRVRVTVEVVS